jgi:hypothetical protein
VPKSSIDTRNPPAHVLHRLERALGLVHERALGDLELEPVRPRARAHEECGEPLREERILHRLHGDVHGDLEARRQRSPVGNGAGGLSQHLERECRGLAARFGERDERRRRDLAAQRVLPPRERLEPDHLAAPEVDERLQGDPDLAAREGLLEFLRDEGPNGRKHGPGRARTSDARTPRVRPRGVSVPCQCSSVQRVPADR